MGILSQGSYLGELTQRLYRALQLDGVVSCKVDDTVQPVVIVGDALRPGMGSLRGRPWSRTFEAFATGTNLALAAPDGTEGFRVLGFSASVSVLAVGDVFRFYQYPIAAVPSGVPVTLNVQALDRGSATDFVPIFTGTGAGAPTVTPFYSAQVAGAINSIGVTQESALEWFIPPGMAVVCRPVITGTFTLSIWGRTFG